MFKLVAFAIMVVLVLALVNDMCPEFAPIIRVVAVALVSLAVIAKMTPLLALLKALAQRAHIPIYLFGIIFKVVGIGYLGYFGVLLCADAGEGALAKHIDTVTKILMIVSASPILLGLLEMISDLL